MNLLPPDVTTPTAPKRPITAVTPAPAPEAKTPPPTATRLKCHPPNQPWNYNIVLDTTTEQRYLQQGWVCDPF